MNASTPDGRLLLEASGLVKSYGRKRVVDALNLSLKRGTVLGLLGPNGAGKTTTLRMLYGFIEPEAGSIRYEGHDFRDKRSEIKRWIGVCTQEDTVDYDFTVRQNLHVYASYFRPRVDDTDRRVTELLQAFGLRDYADMSPYALSGGFKRRLMIARSVVHRPRVLFLDEPTTGLDPKARIDVWALIAQLRTQGMGIVLTTHYMDEAERLSDELLVIANGAAVATGTTSDILGQLLGEHVVVVHADEPLKGRIDHWTRTHGTSPPAVILDELHVPLKASELAAFSADFEALRFSVRPPNLDDLFIKLADR